MKDGFIKVAACTPEIQVADVDFNVDKIISQLEKCREEGVKVAVFPELCIRSEERRVGKECRSRWSPYH